MRKLLFALFALAISATDAAGQTSPAAVVLPKVSAIRDSVYGTFVHVQGFASPGDGGEAYFQRVGGTCTDDGIINIQDKVGNCFSRLIQNNTISTRAVGIPADGTDQSAALQTLINALGPNGGVIDVFKGTKFALTSLNFANGAFPLKVQLRYFTNSETTSGLDANEQVFLFANSNNQGISNEIHICTASFHCGVLMNLRKDNQTQTLGAGQAYSPARLSIIWEDESRLVWFQQYQNWLGSTGVTDHTLDTTNGVYWRTGGILVTITGIGTAEWTFGVPAQGEFVTDGNGTGFIKSVDATHTFILWSGGKFATSGAHLTVRAGTTTATNSAMSESAFVNAPLVQDFMRGNIGVDCLPGYTQDELSLCGRMTFAPTNTFGQQTPRTVATNAAGPCWVSAISNARDGKCLVYDALHNRMVWQDNNADGSAGPQLSLAGAVRLAVDFDNTAAISVSAFNVASIAHPGAGVYTITPSVNFVRSDMVCNVQETNIGDTARVTARATNLITITNYATGTISPGPGTPTNAVGRLLVSCMVGDR